MVALAETSALCSELPPSCTPLSCCSCSGLTGLLFVARVDAGDMPKRLEADGLHPAGDMPHLDAASATLPATPLSSHYLGKFSLVVTTG